MRIRISIITYNYMHLFLLNILVSYDTDTYKQTYTLIGTSMKCLN